MRLDDPVLFKFWNFNGGELGCRFDPDGLTASKYPEVLSARLNTPCSVMKVALAMDALDRANIPLPKVLEVGYMPYARQDKVHERGDPIAVKVVAKLIDSLGFNEIQILDPHSDVTAAAFTTTKVTVDPGTSWVSTFMKNKITDPSRTAIIRPDAGAEKRSNLWAKANDITNIIRVDKKRDPATGEIMGFELLGGTDPEWWKNIDNAFLLDDICDKGGTFMGISKAFYDAGVDLREKLHLYVSHGIFPGDTVDNLRKWFASVGTTNTWQEFDIRMQEEKNLFVQRWFD